MSIPETAQRLAGLGAGERAWFWFADTPRDGAPLRISSLATDPLGQKLTLQTAGVGPLDQTPVLGFVQIDDTGRLHFVSDRGSDIILRRIAQLAQEHAAEHPGLARLRNATMSLVQNGVAIARIDDSALWDGLPAVSVVGTLRHTAARIEALTPGSRAHFWIAGRGPEDRPLLLLGDSTDDPSGEAFAKIVRAARRRCGSQPRDLSGAVTVLRSGRLCFTTDGNPLLVRAFVARLLQEDVPMQRLTDAVFVGRGRQVSLAPNQLDVEFVGSKYEDATVFWLTDVGVHGLPQLVLGRDTEQLKRRVRVAQGRGQHWRGTVHHGRGTTFTIQSDPVPAKAALAAFVQRSTLDTLPRTRIVSTGGE